jgi:hypothetical protein
MLACECAAFELTNGAWGAQKITLSLTLTFTPAAVTGVSTTTRTSGTLSIPANFAFYFQGLQEITTGSKQAVNTGAQVSPLGYCLLHNTDDVNYVSIYSDASGSSEIMRLYPGDYAVWPAGPSTEFYAEANTTAVALEIYTTSR